MDGLRTLMGFYYQPNETDEQRARHIALFVSDLSEFSDDGVWWAIREWRRTQDRRPTPASLRQLCMMRRQEALRIASVTAPRANVHYLPPTEAERARVRALLEEAGYAPKRMGDEA